MKSHERACAIIAVVMLIGSLFLALATIRESRWRLQFDLSDWDWDGIETFSQFGSTQRANIFYHFGPLKFTSHRDIGTVRPILGSNAVEAGMVLYKPSSGREIGTVLKVDDAHHFSEEEVRSAVLIRSPLGVDVWMRRSNLDTCSSHPNRTELRWMRNHPPTARAKWD